jgi:hypothetical protein
VLPEARRLYELAIAYVLGQPEEVIRVSRAVRRHAMKHADQWLVCSMLRWELEAHVERHHAADAWRTWIKLQKQMPGAALKDGDRFLEAALLYFNHRLEEAREAFELALHALMERETPSGYDLLFRVFNSDEPPSSVHRVTLAHIYDGLDCPLDKWPEWSRFVSCLGKPLLRAVSVRREELESNPDLLRQLFQRVVEIRRRRVSTGVTRGEEDVVNSTEEVERSQRQMAQMLRQFDEDSVGDRRKVQDRMNAYFGTEDRPTRR